MILADRAFLVGVKRRIPQPLASELDHLDCVVELEVIPEDRGRIQVALRLAGLQIPDRPDDDLVLGRHVEHPLVVLQKGAGFHFDRAYDAQRHGDLAIPVGQRRLVQDLVIFRRPGHALRACRVEQMNMRVDDR